MWIVRMTDGVTSKTSFETAQRVPQLVGLCLYYLETSGYHKPFNTHADACPCLHDTFWSPSPPRILTQISKQNRFVSSHCTIDMPGHIEHIWYSLKQRLMHSCTSSYTFDGVTPIHSASIITHSSDICGQTERPSVRKHMT